MADDPASVLERRFCGRVRYPDSDAPKRRTGRRAKQGGNQVCSLAGGRRCREQLQRETIAINLMIKIIQIEKFFLFLKKVFYIVII